MREIREKERKRGKYRESVCEREGKRVRGGGRENNRERVCVRECVSERERGRKQLV